MQNKFFGSKLNTLLLAILIIILGITISFLNSNKKIENQDQSSINNTKEEVEKSDNDNKSEDKNIGYISKEQSLMATYKNDTLGISLFYDPQLLHTSGFYVGEIIETMAFSYQTKGFDYRGSILDGAIEFGGKSTNYKNDGRGSGIHDGTENNFKEYCSPNNFEKIITKDGMEGVYVYTDYIIYGDDVCVIQQENKEHIAAFDISNGKIQNIVFTADPNKISKENFISIIKTLEIK